MFDDSCGGCKKWSCNWCLLQEFKERFRSRDNLPPSYPAHVLQHQLDLLMATVADLAGKISTCNDILTTQLVPAVQALVAKQTAGQDLQPLADAVDQFAVNTQALVTVINTALAS